MTLFFLRYRMILRKKSSLQKIGVGFFLCQGYTRLSGWWNLHISTNSVLSIQSFINGWDFVLVVEFPPFCVNIQIWYLVKVTTYYPIVIWQRFYLMYDINIKSRVIIIWTIYIAQSNPESIDLNVYYNVSTIGICTYFMYINRLTFLEENTCKVHGTRPLLTLHICSLYDFVCVSCKITIL